MSQNASNLLARGQPHLAAPRARAWFADNGLTRPREGRMIAGVTAGFARRFGLNVLVARVATVVGVVVLTPLIYLPLWVLMPKDGAPAPSDG